MKVLRILVFFVAFAISHNVAAQTVYVTKTGKKYHKSECRYLKYSKKAIKLDKAKALGYTACKICKPTAKNTKENANSLALKKETKDESTTTKKVIATQCTGKTKSGKRCKRKTKNANGRCYQH
ncbi:hypothetical protein [Winogradskyella sp.]|uniref:hypothetical protein n=1 Tax=Winogradskyella sp. TaxID=1883156 RepID=UPI002637370D|nr:hypothetical protein [Winogradskyella sp.]